MVVVGKNNTSNTEKKKFIHKKKETKTQFTIQRTIQRNAHKIITKKTLSLDTTKPNIVQQLLISKIKKLHVQGQTDVAVESPVGIGNTFTGQCIVSIEDYSHRTTSYKRVCEICVFAGVFREREQCLFWSKTHERPLPKQHQESETLMGSVVDPSLLLLILFFERNKRPTASPTTIATTATTQTMNPANCPLFCYCHALDKNLGDDDIDSKLFFI